MSNRILKLGLILILSIFVCVVACSCDIEQDNNIIVPHTNKVADVIPTKYVRKWDISFNSSNKITAYITYAEGYSATSETPYYHLDILGKGQMRGATATTRQEYEWHQDGYADKIKSITVSDYITVLGRYCFYNLTALESVSLRFVTAIPSSAFYGCESLEQITLYQGMTTIADNCFNGCTKLKTITLPQSLNSIGETAFKDCNALTTVNYAGTEEQWNLIQINSEGGEGAESGNKDLTNATINYLIK